MGNRRSSVRFRASSTCNGRTPRYVTSARRMTSAPNVSIATSGHPEMLEMWRNDMHVIFGLLFDIHFHLSVSSDVAQLLSSTQMGCVGLTKDSVLPGKMCLSKLKNTHFVERVKSCIFAQVPSTRSPWWLNYEERCLISSLHASLLVPYILRWLLMFVEDFSTPDWSCN